MIYIYKYTHIYTDTAKYRIKWLSRKSKIMLVSGTRNIVVDTKPHAASEKPLPTTRKHDEKYMGRQGFSPYSVTRDFFTFRHPPGAGKFKQLTIQS